jgi:hypothetical protein
VDSPKQTDRNEPGNSIKDADPARDAWRIVRPLKPVKSRNSNTASGRFCEFQCAEIVLMISYDRGLGKTHQSLKGARARCSV